MVGLPSKFNIRVYGIWVRDHKILLSEERIDAIHMLKFPGGGVEFGEGLQAALRREFKEELDIELDHVAHLHTLEDFVQSRFRPDEQVLTVHYTVRSTQDPLLHPRRQPTRLGTSNRIEFHWAELTDTLVERLTFEADRTALQIVLNRRD